MQFDEYVFRVRLTALHVIKTGLETLDMALESDEVKLVFLDERLDVGTRLDGRTSVGMEQRRIGVLHGPTLVKLRSVTCTSTTHGYL